MTDIALELSYWLREQGADAVEVDRKHKHPRIYFSWRGTRQFQVVPSTSSDRRSLENARSDLRHTMRLIKPVKTIGERRKRRVIHKAEKVSCPRLTVLADSREQLGTFPGLTAYKYEQAWLGLWRDAMKGKSLL